MQYKLITVRDVTYLLPDTMSLLLHLHILWTKLDPSPLGNFRNLNSYLDTVLKE